MLHHEDIITFIEKTESGIIAKISKYPKFEIIKEALLLYHNNHVSVTGPLVVNPEMSYEEYVKFSTTKCDWFIPHYLICLTLLTEEEGAEELDEIALKDILGECRANALLMFYLNNRKTHELISINEETFRMELKALEKADWRYSDFYSQILKRSQKFESVDLDQHILEYHDLFSEVWQEYARRQGFMPQSVFALLFCIGYIMYDQAQELGISNDEYKKQNPVVIFSKNKLDKYFEKVPTSQKEATLSNVILPKTVICSYLDSLKTKKRQKELFSLPLWDYPLVENRGQILTTLTLIFDAVPELAERIKQKDPISESKLNEYRHKKLIEEIKEILIKKYYEVETNILLPDGEIDVLAKKDNNVLHIECKARSMSWKNRMFIQEDDELDALYHRFLLNDRINPSHWKKKCESVKNYLRTKYGKDFVLSNIVITKNPMPVPNEHKLPEIVWLRDLDDWFVKFQQQG